MTLKLNHTTNRLPLYFTGVMTVMILMVGTVLLFQILNIQNTHVEMEAKQDLLLQELEINQKEMLENQALFVNETKILTRQQQLNLTNHLLEESDKNLVMFDAQNIVVNNIAKNITEINDKLTQLLPTLN